jgi:hypothetical protein
MLIAYLCVGINFVIVILLGFSTSLAGEVEFAKVGGWAYRMLYIYIAAIGARFFYYTPFCFSDASFIACGLAYNGADPDKWDRVYSIDIIGLETCWSPAEAVKLWNHQVHIWLKNYVQARVVTPGMRPTAKHTMMVFIVSSIWHGFYPYYYVLFIFAALNLELCKDIYKSRYLLKWIP